MAIGDNTESVELSTKPECEWCGDNYDPTQSDASDKAKYCSVKCEAEEAAANYEPTDEDEDEESDEDIDYTDSDAYVGDEDYDEQSRR